MPAKYFFNTFKYNIFTVKILFDVTLVIILISLRDSAHIISSFIFQRLQLHIAFMFGDDGIVIQLK